MPWFLVVVQQTADFAYIINQSRLICRYTPPLKKKPQDGYMSTENCGRKYFHHKNLVKSLLLIWKLANKIRYSVQYVYALCIRDDINTTFIFKFCFGVIIFFVCSKKTFSNILMFQTIFLPPPSQICMVSVYYKVIFKRISCSKVIFKRIRKESELKFNC